MAKKCPQGAPQALKPQLEIYLCPHADSTLSTVHAPTTTGQNFSVPASSTTFSETASAADQSRKVEATVVSPVDSTSGSDTNIASSRATPDTGIRSSPISSSFSSSIATANERVFLATF
ncbi:hypothetical protein ACEPAI_3304 [Sanghuangporus weigelae]